MVSNPEIFRYHIELTEMTNRIASDKVLNAVAFAAILTTISTVSALIIQPAAAQNVVPANSGHHGGGSGGGGDNGGGSGGSTGQVFQYQPQ